MMRLITVVILSCLFMLYANVYGEETGKETKLYSIKIVEDKFDISLMETEREANFSIVRVIFKKGSSVGSSMFIFKGMYDIAKLRKNDYFFKAKEWEDENGDYFYKVYFFNDKNIPLKKLLGEDYSEEAQELFDELGYQSVEDLDRMFNER